MLAFNETGSSDSCGNIYSCSGLAIAPPMPHIWIIAYRQKYLAICTPLYNHSIPFCTSWGLQSSTHSLGSKYYSSRPLKTIPDLYFMIDWLPNSILHLRVKIPHLKKMATRLQVKLLQREFWKGLVFFSQGTLSKGQNRSAVDWRKVLLVLFMIFVLGPYLESLWNGLTSEPIRCGVKEFFHPNNWLWSIWHKKREKSLWCLNFGQGEKS